MAMPPGPGPMGGPPMGVGPGGPVTPQQAMMHQQAQMAGGPPPGMNPGQPMPGGPPHPGPGQGPPGPGQPMEQPRFDNISKAKALVPQLKESLMVISAPRDLSINFFVYDGCFAPVMWCRYSICIRRLLVRFRVTLLSL